MKVTVAIRVSFTCLLLHTSYLFAQLGTNVSGEVVDISGRADPRWSVELRPLSDSRSAPPARAFLQLDRQFQFSGIEPGTYELLVLDPNQQVAKREVALVASTTNNTIQIRLGGPGSPTPTAKPAGAISLRQLTHQVPKEARKEFRRAIRERDRSNPAAAEIHFRKALELDPECVEASNDLGALYYRVGRYAESLEVLERAHAIEPRSSVVLANLAATLLALRRPQDAEALAGRAVAGDPVSIRPRYLLALSRAANGKTDVGTRTMLEEVAATIPHANLALAQLYAAEGNRPAARRAVERYLAKADKAGQGDTNVRSAAERYLNSLR